MNVDFSEVDNIEDLRAVPPGEYLCRVAEVRESDSPSGHRRWGLRWEVAEGEFVGRTACWDSLHWSERGLPRAKYVLQVLGLEVDGPVEIHPADLEGRRAWVSCTAEEREDPITGIRRLMNRVPFAGYKVAPDAAGDGAEPRPGEP
ncbi:MAG: hypothetical protein D6702_03860 [Planctomycetota bacterium]|nr:MAG: hypothetical protein D6702_03860 [Planctomycetota bacterium]